MIVQTGRPQKQAQAKPGVIPGNTNKEFFERKLDKMKKLFALVLSLALVVAFAVPALASGWAQLDTQVDNFKNITLRHAYKSVFAIGSYASYSTFQEYMNGLGFITDATTGNPIPNTMYNISTGSVNESFSPLLGIDVTLQNNMTCKLEYRTTRVLSLSMTSVQINEALSKDWVIGMAYKISNFNLFSGKASKKIKKAQKGKKARYAGRILKPEKMVLLIFQESHPV